MQHLALGKASEVFLDDSDFVEKSEGVERQQLLRAACAVGFDRARMSAIYRFLRGVDPASGETSVEGRRQKLAKLDTAANACLHPTTWRDYLLRVSHAGCARALFSDQLLQTFLAPGPAGNRAASEQHHLFPKAWLVKQGITDRRAYNQVSNLADVGWTENAEIGASGPAKYVPRLREKLGLDDSRWGRMCSEHALPPGWEAMPYEAFLEQRRERMADIIRAAFPEARRRGGSCPDRAALVSAWRRARLEPDRRDRACPARRGARGLCKALRHERRGEDRGGDSRA
jgi:hypothetical protein